MCRRKPRWYVLRRSFSDKRWSPIAGPFLDKGHARLCANANRHTGFVDGIFHQNLEVKAIVVSKTKMIRRYHIEVRDAHKAIKLYEQQKSIESNKDLEHEHLQESS